MKTHLVAFLAGAGSVVLLALISGVLRHRAGLARSRADGERLAARLRADDDRLEETPSYGRAEFYSDLTRDELVLVVNHADQRWSQPPCQ